MEDQNELSAPPAFPYSRVRSSRLSANFSAAVQSPACSRLPCESEQKLESDGPAVVESIINILQSRNLPGPMIMISDREYLGQGSQFVVYKQRMVWNEGDRLVVEDVAVKQPKFDIGPFQRVNIARKDARQHVNHLLLEIEALTMPLLQRHANIVSLLSWSYDAFSFQKPITLIMRLASSDLESFLSQGKSIDLWRRFGLCSHIAAGLDAIHQCQMVHGDLKPSNVLIFEEGKELVAKLSDFGLSVGELNSQAAETRLGGTSGWQAPEVEEGRQLTPEGLVKADNYSFALVDWYTMSCSTSQPKIHEREKWMAGLEAERAESKAVDMVLSRTATALDLLLQSEPEKRPISLESLFNIEKVCHDAHLSIQSLADLTLGAHSPEEVMSEVSTESATPSESSAEVQRVTLPWEISHLPDFFLADILSDFNESKTAVRPGVIFTAFLSLSTAGNATAYKEHSPLDLLVTSATRGYAPAQALIPTVFAFHEQDYPATVKVNIVKWLGAAVATGFIAAQKELWNIEPAAAAAAIQEFRDAGGYGQFYFDVPGLSRLHLVASSGTVAELKAVFDSESDLNIEERTQNGETALYLACARGSWEIALELLNRGAEASTRSTSFQISCLHWVFAFDPAVLSQAVPKLLENGADPNALVPESVPFFHYPFVLPGTPLHWAVLLESSSAIAALLEHGADPTIRDKSDPYKYDGEVRMLDKFGGENQESFSIPRVETEGLSPLDYAAMNHSPCLFETLLAADATVNINDVDEEGLTVLHRLSAGPVRRTKTQLRFSMLPFQGSRFTSKQRLEKTVYTIKALGGNLNQLTTPQQLIERAGQPPARYMSHTPLMMAVVNGQCDVVRSLIDAGASINAENNRGRTALQCLPEDDEAALEIAHILLSAGADDRHRDSTGMTAAVMAAHRKNVDVLELLLSSGADIEEKDSNPDSSSVGTGMFALLAATISPFEERSDERVASLLERFVLNHPDTDKKTRVVEQPDLRGQTLLYYFAHRSMMHTVDMLVRHGAEVNALSTKYTTSVRGPERTRVKVSWQETPLDAALFSKQRFQDNMRINHVYSLPEYEDLIRRADAVIDVLRRAGGVQAQREETCTPWIPN